MTHPAGKAAPTTLVEYLSVHKVSPLRLHLGCGGDRWRDFVNVDLYPADDSAPDSSRYGCVADAYADVRCLGLPDDSVDEIFTAHMLEHFTKWDAAEMLADWRRMLKPGGILAIETPDFWRCVLWLFHPSRQKRYLGRTQFYGNQWDRLEYETHRYVWSARELRGALGELGFRNVVITHKTLTHYPGRDMRVEAVK